MTMWSTTIPVFALCFVRLSYCKDSQIPLALDNHVYIPSLGFGTWNLDKSNVSEVVSVAIQTGYRHLDCAAAYGNEKEVGRGIAEGIRKAGIDRLDLWVTSKLWNNHHRPDQVEAALDQTLSDLGLDYIDLYLMHWPVASTPHGNVINYLDTWNAMGKISRHKARNIGVCNFAPDQLKRLVFGSYFKPAVHQMEAHPYLQQVDYLEWHKKHDITFTAYSPLAGTNPTYHSPDSHENLPPPLLKNPTVSLIAKKRGCTPAQVAVAWGIGRGTIVIPKSSHAAHIKENFDALNCELHEEDFQTIGELREKYLKRYNNPSKRWGVDLFEGLEDVDYASKCGLLCD